jgi:guanylate kinase
MDREIVSFTTRKPREGEIDGVDYIFIEQSEFDRLLNNNGLIEHTNYSGNFYGVTREEYESKLGKGDTFFICDNKGMRQMKAIHSNCVSIFIYCDRETVESNMRQRGDTEEDISKRLKTYDDEVNNLVYYDYVVTNKLGFLEDAVEDVRDIIGG